MVYVTLPACRRITQSFVILRHVVLADWVYLTVKWVTFANDKMTVLVIRMITKNEQ